MITIDIVTITALLAAGAIMAPALSKHIPEKEKLKAQLDRTGSRVLKDEERSRITLDLSRAGVNMSAETFKGLQLFTLGLGLAVGMFFLLIGSSLWFWFIVSGILGYFFMTKWIKNKIEKRKQSIRRELDTYTLLISTVLAAGGNEITAIQRAGEVMKTDLKQLTEEAVKEINAGRNFRTALTEMFFKVDLDELNALTRTLIQVYEKGTEAADTMRAFSKHMLEERKREATSEAGKLAVKILFPILICIFVPLMLLIGYPLMYNFMNSL